MFFSRSNHTPETRDALNWIGYHAYPTNGPYTPDPNTFSLMFDYVDEFITKVQVNYMVLSMIAVTKAMQAIDTIINKLSPNTLTALDESGTAMSNVLDPK
jgi:hypothetical protein